MTAHPLNVPVISPQGTSSKITTQTTTPIVKSKTASVDSSYTSVTSPSGRSQSIVTEAASLDLSAEGISLLQNTNRSPIRNTEEAKSLMKSISDNLKQNPEANVALHANLRAMKINQLVFD